MASFELDRRSVAGRAMAPLWNLEHLDVVADVGARLAARGVDLPAHAFAFEQLEEALGASVVVAVAPLAHAADQVACAQERLPLMAGKLAALIRVHRHGVFRPAAPQRHQQRVQNQSGCRCGCPWTFQKWLTDVAVEA